MGSALGVAAGLGAAIAVQVSVLGRVAGRFDVLTVSMVLQLGGLASGAVWVTVRDGWGEAAAVARLWWWLPLGLIGWVLVAGLGFASARIGVAATLSVSVAGQLVAGLALDAGTGTAVGLRGLLGLLLLVASTVLLTTRG